MNTAIAKTATKAITTIKQHQAFVILTQLKKTGYLLAQKAIVAIIILLVFWLIAIAIQKIVLRIHKKYPGKKNVFKIIADISKITVLIIGIITALGSAGVNVSAIVASLGLSSFALGFAFKDSLSNILAGFMIMIYQPYSIGDKIVVTSSEGTVTEINLRYTILRNEDRNILIPNSTMLNSTMSIVDKA